MDKVLRNLIRVGRVSSLNPARATARVAFGDKDDLVSYDLPVLMPNAGVNRDYALPDVDDQVVCLFLPNGIAQGFILGGFYSTADPPPAASADKRLVRFSDGGTVEYDRAASVLTVNTPGAVRITASGGVTITGDTAINGNLQVSGSVNAGGSVIDAAGNTNHHKH